jgi:hypothetical protein
MIGKSMRRVTRRQVGLVASLAAAVAVALVAAGANGGRVHSTGRSMPEATGGGQVPIERTTAVLIRGGSFARNTSARGFRERANAAMAVENAKPRFKGWVNGIYFYPSGVNAGSFETDPFPCGKPEVREVGDAATLKASRFWFAAPRYVPAGTYENFYPFGLACPAGTFLVERDFEVRPAGGMLLISRTSQPFFVGFPVSRDRLQATTLAGRPAVLVRPLTEEGFGGAAVIVRLRGSIVRVQSDTLPLNELVQVAASMSR